MALSVAVQQCMQERQYVIAVSYTPTYFRMQINGIFDPHNGHPHIGDFVYDQRTDSFTENFDSLDLRLIRHIRDTISCMRRSDEPAKALYEAFEELAGIVHF